MSTNWKTVKGCTVVDQKVKQKKNDGNWMVVLTVQFPTNDEAGVPVTKDILLQFTNEERAAKTYTILQYLGFDDLDFTKLDPDSNEYFPLKGKVVDVTNQEGSPYWNIHLPKKTDVSAAKSWLKDQKDMLISAKKPVNF